MIMYLLAILPIIYLIWLIIIIISWTKIPAEIPGNNFSEQIAVIIPVRNEAGQLGFLLEDFDHQDYPGNLYSVIVIDDSSTDGTADLVKKFQKVVHYPLQYKHIRDNNLLTGVRLSGKKSAITLAVESTNAEIILQTDGDCRIGRRWISSMVSSFRSGGCRFVAGPVIYPENGSLYSQLLLMDIASLVSVSAAFIQSGIPVMCNGACMAYRKDAFNEVKGYSDNSDIASGDDSFLMHKIHGLHENSVRFCKSSEALASTIPATGLREFIQQRIRWAGKWNLHSSSTIKILAVFIFLVHLDFIFLTGWSLLSAEFTLWIQLFILRLGLEWVMLRNYFNFCGKKLKIFAFLIACFLYSFYAVFFGILANTTKFTWKGRTYNN